MKNRALISIAAVIFLGFVGWYVLAPSRAPAGQPEMVVLSSKNIQQFRSAFNRESSDARLILLVSPT
ncbi:MAG: hypothetical protein ACRD4A_04235 [Candidatus Acidiferrales bacterium]